MREAEKDDDAATKNFKLETFQLGGLKDQQMKPRKKEKQQTTVTAAAAGDKTASMRLTEASRQQGGEGNQGRSQRR